MIFTSDEFDTEMPSFKIYFSTLAGSTNIAEAFTGISTSTSTIPSMAVDVVFPRAEFLNRWTTTNEDTNVPRFVATKSALKGFSSYFVEKGDFVKIKSISLGYNLSVETCKMLAINNLRVYGAIQNPFQITSYSGLDTEAALGSPLTQGADWGAYPNGKNFMVGLNFTF